MKSLEHRLIFLFSMMLTVVLLITGFQLSHDVEGHFEDMDRAMLQTHLNQVINRLNDLEEITDLDIEETLRLSSQAPVALALFVIAPDQTDWQIGLSLDEQTFQKIVSMPNNKLQSYIQGNLHVRLLKTKIQLADQDWSIVALQDIHHHELFLDKFMQMLLWALGFALLLAIPLITYAIRKLLQPLTQTVTRMQTTSVSDLLQKRLELPETTELRQLALAYNTMLDRLLEAFTRLQGFAADLAHEIRSPLNALMLQTEVTLSKVRTAEEYQEQLLNAQEDLQRLAHAVDEMLFLSKTDKGLMHLDREKIELKPMIQALLNYFEVLSEEKHQTLIFSGNAQILVDKLLIQRALSNLLNNAIEHAPEGDKIEINISVSKDFTDISFENSSQISVDEVGRLFDRFWRKDSARGHTNHLGLGLPIVKSILELHEGEIFAELIGQRLKFTCRIKRTG